MERYNLNVSRIAVGGASAALVYTPETGIQRLPVTITNEGSVAVKLYCSSDGVAPADLDNYKGLLPETAIEVNPDVKVWGISTTADVCNVVVDRGIRHVGIATNVFHHSIVAAIVSVEAAVAAVEVAVDDVETAVEAVEDAVETADTNAVAAAALELDQSRSLASLVEEMILLQRIMLTHFAGWSGEELGSTDAAVI